MNKPNFFCDLDAQNYLIGLEYPNEHKTVDVTINFIDAPYGFVFTTDEESWKMRAIQCGELFTHNESTVIGIGTLTVNKTTDEGAGSTTDPVLHQNFGAFFQTCRNLNFYAQENN